MNMWQLEIPSCCQQGRTSAIATQPQDGIKDISTQTCMNIHLNAQRLYVSESIQYKHAERASAHRRGNFSNCLSSSDLLCWMSLREI